MNSKPGLIIALTAICLFTFGCGNQQEQKTDTVSAPAQPVAAHVDLSRYSKVPDADDFYKTPVGLQLVDTLESRFTKDLIAFNAEVNASHAKLIVCYITSELGNSLTKCERKEGPFIKSLCQKQGISFVDFTNELKNKPELTFVPVDGHFNQKGAIVIADKVSGIIDINKDYRSNISYPPSSRPALLGDDDPGIDKIVEDKPGLPYKLTTNKQGLRMDGLVEFPKKQQHILLMGDSELYFAGVDNPQTITGVLQKKYPDKTIINAAKWAYSIDDELSQWKDRAKYTEPDVVILELNGRDITDLFFSQKIRFHRFGDNKNFVPSPLEVKFYNETFQ